MTSTLSDRLINYQMWSLRQSRIHKTKMFLAYWLWNKKTRQLAPRFTMAKSTIFTSWTFKVKTTFLRPVWTTLLELSSCLLTHRRSRRWPSRHRRVLPLDFSSQARISLSALWWTVSSWAGNFKPIKLNWSMVTAKTRSLIQSFLTSSSYFHVTPLAWSRSEINHSISLLLQLISGSTISLSHLHPWPF